MNLDDLFSLTQERLQSLFQTYIFDANYPEKKLQTAISYAIKNGGKRIRPAYVYAVGYLFKTPWENVDAAAVSIELIHTYSLIHDDLPAMDNSDLRRGKPSCHKAFDEATAILAGDALQPLAFEILGNHPSSLSSEQRLQMINLLSSASGLNGMAAGQAIDLAGVTTLEALNTMYQLKTGALLSASVELGLIASNIQESKIKNALKKHIENIGLAFQIQDDLLDVIGDEKIIGKPKNLDQSNNKTTYPALLGPDKTRDKIQTLFDEAIHAIEFLGNDAEILRKLAYYLLHREK